MSFLRTRCGVCFRDLCTSSKKLLSVAGSICEFVLRDKFWISVGVDDVLRRSRLVWTIVLMCFSTEARDRSFLCEPEITTAAAVPAIE